MGDHAAARYRHFRRFVESLEGETLDASLFGLLLSAESMKDEMRAYDEHKSALVRLAETGHFVRQLRRLHGILDAASAAYDVNEPKELREWEAALGLERSERVEWFRGMLQRLKLCTGSHKKARGSELATELDDEDTAEMVLTLLKAAVNKYGSFVLTDQELQISKVAFDLVSQYSNLLVLTLPTWVVSPFEFTGTASLARWGNELIELRHSDPEQAVRSISTWAELNHPHVAKFLGACHIGKQRFVAHEATRSLAEYAGQVRDRKKVWSRIGEVASALLYIHERGLVFSCLDKSTVRCAQFEDKAVILGVNLVSIKVEANTTPIVAREPSPGSLGALGGLILTALGAIPLGLHQGPKDDAELRSFEATTYQPDFVNDDEWHAIQEISGLRQDSSSDIMRFIKNVYRLVEAIDTSDTQDAGTGTAAKESTDISQMEVAPLGIMIAEVVSQCELLAGENEEDLAVSERVRKIFEHIRGSDDAALHEEAIPRFVRALTQFYQYVAQKHRSNASSRIGMSRRGPTLLYKLHSDLDDISFLLKIDELNPDTQHWGPVVGPALNAAHLELNIVPEEVDGDSRDREEADALARFDLVRYGRIHISDDHTGEQSNQKKLPRWFVPPSEVDFASFAEFSRGSFGSVHLGKWFETPVVIKRVFMEGEDRGEVQARFLHEADVWFELNHINVVKMYGACHVGDPFFICEHASGGDLDTYLSRHDRDPYLVWYCLLNAALGLQYLHDNGVVHADLKANNMLVGADDVPKLADFGLSTMARGRIISEDEGAVGAYRWKAPECLPSKDEPGKAATFASDVYSFAMVMIEVVSGSFPWGGSIPDAAVRFHVKKGKLPPRPQGIADPEWRLIEKMCCLDPLERLSIDAVVVHLSSMIERFDMEKVAGGFEYGEAWTKNRVVARGGALLTLTQLAKSGNPSLAEFAMGHLLAVHMSRGGRSDKEELAEIVDMLGNGTDDEKEWAARSLVSLSFSYFENNSGIIAAGAIPLLVNLLRNGTEPQQRAAAAALDNLTNDENCTASIVAAGAIDPLMLLVRDGTEYQKQFAAGALTCLAMNDEVRNTPVDGGVIAPLLEQIRDGDDHQKKNAAERLFCLSGFVAICETIVTLGGIADLLVLARDGNDDQKCAAAGVLWNTTLYTMSAGPQVIKHNGVKILLDIVSNESNTTQVLAAGIFGSLDVDTETKALVAQYGGIAAVVAEIEDIETYDYDKEEDVAALLGLCKEKDAMVLYHLENTNAREVLTKLAQSNRNKLRNLASELLQIMDEYTFLRD